MNHAVPCSPVTSPLLTSDVTPSRGPVHTAQPEDMVRRGAETAREFPHGVGIKTGLIGRRSPRHERMEVSIGKNGLAFALRGWQERAATNECGAEPH